MMNFNLLAIDWWNWLIPAVFVIIYLINHLLSGANAGGAKQAQQQRRRQGPPPGGAPGRPQQQPPAQGQPQLNAEIEQFLKRANERRMEKARREAAPQATAAAAAAAPAPQRLAERAVDIRPLNARDFNAVEMSVQQHLGDRGFDSRAQHLADDILRQEAEMQKHLDRAFNHRVGTLGREEEERPKVTDQAPAAAADRAATAKALAGLLANQANIRQAIVLKEILERPTDRW